MEWCKSVPKIASSTRLPLRAAVAQPATLCGRARQAVRYSNLRRPSRTDSSTSAPLIPSFTLSARRAAGPPHAHRCGKVRPPACSSTPRPRLGTARYSWDRETACSTPSMPRVADRRSANLSGGARAAARRQPLHRRRQLQMAWCTWARTLDRLSPIRSQGAANLSACRCGQEARIMNRSSHRRRRW